MANPSLGAHFISPTFINASTYTTSAIITQATGSAFVVFVSHDSTATLTVTDSKSNSYSRPTLTSGANPIADTNDSLQFSVFTCIGGTGGTAHTFSANGGGGLVLLEAVEVVAASAADTSASAYNGASGTTLSVPVTPTQANDFLIACAFIGGGTTTAVPGGAGWTALESTASTYTMGSGYLASASTSAQDPVMTSGHSGWGMVAFNLAFSGSGGGGGGTAISYYLGSSNFF